MNRSLRPLLATALIFLFAYLLAVLQHPAMFSTRVLGNFLTDNAFLGIAAVGMTFVILSGGIDLSVGAVIGFTTVLIAVLIMWLNLHPLVAFAVALTVAALFGAIMGAAIHYLKVPSFIVTLAGMFLARGGASVLSPDSIGIEHEFYSAVSKSYILLPGGGRLTVVGMIMLAVFAVAIVLAHRTKFGSNVYAIGGSETSAALMGVPVARTTIAIYALSSFLAGLAGVVFSLYTSAGYSLNALGVELGRNRRCRHRRHASDRGIRLCRRDIHRRHAAGVGANLHRFRRNLVQLVDQDCSRCAVVYVHRAAAACLPGRIAPNLETLDLMT